MPPPGPLARAFRATGRPVQALLDTLIVKSACGPMTRCFTAMAPGRFHPVRRVSIAQTAAKSSKLTPAAPPVNPSKGASFRNSARRRIGVIPST